MGYLRLSLIIPVMYFHLVDSVLAGAIAVYGFFILSGYVITLVSTEIYHQGWKGRGYFIANRIARVWPTYLVCLVLSILTAYAVGFTTGLYHDEYLFPSSWQSWLIQFSILGQSDFSGERYPERLLLPAWSLSTEIAYYLIIGLVTGKSRKLTTAAFLLAALQSAYGLYHELSYQYFYFSIQGPAIAFFMGGMFYHYRHMFKVLYLQNTIVLVGLANLIIYAPDILGLPRKSIVILYVTTFYLGYIIMCLHTRSADHNKSSKIDQFLADLTYPMFLLHWPVGALICYYLFNLYQRNIEVFMIALPATILISAIIVLAIEIPGKRLRRHFREKARR